MTPLSGLAQFIRHNLSWAFVCLTVPAHAATAESQPAEPYRLVWSSSAGCEDAEGFSSELKSRTALLRDAEREEHAITLIVETFPEGARVRGRLTLRRPSGEVAVREVPGESCEEVESAMALIAALMVDPLAADLAPVPRRPAQPAVTRRAAPVPAPSPSDWSMRVEYGPMAQSGVAPGVAWGQAARLVVTRESSYWQPSFGVSGRLAQATTSVPAGSAELEWTAAQVTLCPVTARPSLSWDLRACAAFQLGRLKGTGFETASPASQSVLWAAPGVALEGRFQLVGPLWGGGDGALTFPLTRESFYLDPQQTVHRVPVWSINVGAFVGLSFF